jgi:hypothetical protein
MAKRVILYDIDFSRFECLDRNPDALDAAVGHANAFALKVGAENSFVRLGNVRTDTATFFALTLA